MKYVLFLFILSMVVFSQNNSNLDEFEKMKQETEKKFKENSNKSNSQAQKFEFKADKEFGNKKQEADTEHKKAIDKMEKQWNEQYKKVQKQWEEHVRKVNAQWGKVKIANKEEWVEYSKDKKTFSTVNFDEDKGGFIEIKTIVDEKTPPKVARKNIERRLNSILKEEDLYTRKPILKGMVSKWEAKKRVKKIEKEKEIEIIVKEELEEIATEDIKKEIVKEKQETINQKKQETTEIKPKIEKRIVIVGKNKKLKVNVGMSLEGKIKIKKKKNNKKLRIKEKKKKVVYKVKLPLKKDHLDTRAKRYKKVIEKQAKRFDVKPELVMAVVHTESSFNPKAHSPAGAYGLMQLIPKYGAYEGYEYAYKKKKVIKHKELYNAETNIELGAAYLSKLDKVYFKKIKDEEKRKYVVVASYNWGPTIVNKKIVKPNDIDGMKAELLYKELREKSPEETSNYLERVTKREKKYAQYF